MRLTKVVAVLAAMGLSDAAQAATIQTQTQVGGYYSNTYGGSEWTTFKGYIDAAASVIQTTSFDTIGSGVDALLINQEVSGVLGASEQSAIAAFVSAGHKAVIFGENSSWTSWNASILALTGATATNTCNYSSGTALVANDLTAGAGTVWNVCGSTFTGPGALYSNGVAGLVGLGAGQVLYVMDSNVIDNYFRTDDQNDRFARNIAAWMAAPLNTAPAPVPVPATLPLMVAGLGGLVALRRRKAK